MADGLDAEERLLSFGGGTLALFIGTAIVSSRLVRPIAALVGWPIARLGGAAGGLARENAVRNPARTASTAAALMIGLALVTFVSVARRRPARLVALGRLGAGRGRPRRDLVERLGGRPARRRPRAVGLPAWARSRASAGTRASSRAPARRSSGVDAATIGDTYRFTWSDGSDAALSTLDSRRRDPR